MPRASVQVRLWTRIKENPETGCWEFRGFRNRRGYGVLSHGGEHEGAHRVAYRLINGEIPDGLFVCHRCDNPPCCNPEHLFVGTALDNTRDMDAKGRGRRPTDSLGAWHRAKTHCPQGHAYDEANTRRDRRGRRSCRACARARHHATKPAPKPREVKPPKTHCPAGHAYAGENLYVDRKGVRNCKECKRASNRRSRTTRLETSA